MAMDKKRWMALVKDVSPTYLIILYGVLVLALGLVLSSVVLVPQEARIAEKSRQLQQEQQKVAVIENFILAHPDMDKHLAELMQAMHKADVALPGSMDVSAFLAQLEKDARAAGVKLTQVKPSTITDRAGYREMPIEVMVEGTYFSTLSFMKKMEDGARFSVPAAFLTQQKQNVLTTRLNLQIFCYGITPRPASAPAAKGPPAGQPPAGVLKTNF